MYLISCIIDIGDRWFTDEEDCIWCYLNQIKLIKDNIEGDQNINKFTKEVNDLVKDDCGVYCAIL